METDSDGFEILPRTECLRLLGTTSLGRVALTSAALPLVLPVGFRVLEDGIVFATGRGTKLEAATQDAVVAFETDDIDADGEGWSVLVTGVARELTEPEEMEAVGALPLPKWAVGPPERLVRLSLRLVSGRRIAKAPLIAPTLNGHNGLGRSGEQP